MRILPEKHSDRNEMQQKCSNVITQAGTAPKIANGLQNVKVLVNLESFILKKIEKCLTMAKKTEREDPLGFFNMHSVENSKKLKGGPFGGNFFLEKSRTVPKKNLKGGPFGLVRYCILRGEPFWFSSLGQQVQFGVFSNFCRTFAGTILVTSGGLKKH